MQFACPVKSNPEMSLLIVDISDVKPCITFICFYFANRIIHTEEKFQN